MEAPKCRLCNKRHRIGPCPIEPLSSSSVPVPLVEGEDLRLRGLSQPAASVAPSSIALPRSPSKFDRVVYQREYMRNYMRTWRAKKEK